MLIQEGVGQNFGKQAFIIAESSPNLEQVESLIHNILSPSARSWSSVRSLSSLSEWKESYITKTFPLTTKLYNCTEGRHDGDWEEGGDSGGEVGGVVTVVWWLIRSHHRYIHCCGD